MAAAYEDRFFTTPAGLRLHYLDWGGDGPPMLFIHPTGFHAHVWDSYAAHFRDRFRCLAVDTRGHGDSDRPGVYSWDAMAGDVEALADAIRRVADGDAVFSPRLAGFVLDAFASFAPAEVDPELDQLTTREREVLRHIARGYLYKEIAARLGISTKTVEAHVSAVLRKLQLSSRHELSRWAVERRLVD